MTTGASPCIVGVGQRLAGDDGVGPAVIDFLRGQALPSDVVVTEVREPSALLPLLDEARGRLIIVDAVLAEPAGEVLELDRAAVDARGLVSVSSHGLSVGQVLALARVTAAPGAVEPEVRVVAITIAAPVRGAAALSPAVASCVPRAARLALALAGSTSTRGG